MSVFSACLKTDAIFMFVISAYKPVDKVYTAGKWFCLYYERRLQYLVHKSTRGLILLYYHFVQVHLHCTAAFDYMFTLLDLIVAL